MRFSRRNRYGIVTPTNVTYAHAINVCQKADTVDLKLVDRLLGWAEDDNIAPTVFMYASAIWAAQKSSNCAKALEYFNAMESTGCMPNAVAYDGMISALSEKGDFEEAVKLYERTRGLGNEVSPSTMMVSILVVVRLTLSMATYYSLSASRFFNPISIQSRR